MVKECKNIKILHKRSFQKRWRNRNAEMIRCIRHFISMIYRGSHTFQFPLPYIFSFIKNKQRFCTGNNNTRTFDIFRVIFLIEMHYYGMFFPLYRKNGKYYCFKDSELHNI